MRKTRLEVNAKDENMKEWQRIIFLFYFFVLLIAHYPLIAIGYK